MFIYKTSSCISNLRWIRKFEETYESKSDTVLGGMVSILEGIKKSKGWSVIN